MSEKLIKFTEIGNNDKKEDIYYFGYVLRDIHKILEKVYSNPSKYKKIFTKELNLIEKEVEQCFCDKILEYYNNGTITNFGNYFEERLEVIHKTLIDLTKHDKEIDPSTLTKDEIIQAFNNSITKFIELHYQQPRELKAVLISYENTPLLDYVEITKAMTKDNKELQLLNKIFKEYKQDTKGVIYNYSLFAFLYYAYGLYVSFEHLYNSELLKLLGAYTFKKDRDKPLLKPNHKNLLQHHKDACILSQYDVNIYLENFISFIQQVDAKLKDRYVLSYLVDLSHELTASKEYINRLKNTPYNFSKVSYQDLPQPIKTLLLPIKTLQSA